MVFNLIMQQERPTLPEDISPELAFIIQSCWVEDPNLRPSFSQIIRLLNTFLFTLSPPSPSLPESDTNEAEAAASSNGTMTEFSARARGKFSFIRQLFTAKRTKNSQWAGKILKFSFCSDFQSEESWHATVDIYS